MIEDIVPGTTTASPSTDITIQLARSTFFGYLLLEIKHL